jgi:RNA ligase
MLNMKDPILLNKLWKEVEAGRVAASQSGDLTVFKYTQETHIKDLWNDVNRLARGIIFRTDGTVVARPFTKFFNLNERSESEIKNLPWDESIEVYEKVDGSCGIGYVHAGPLPRESAPVYVDGVTAGYMPSWRLATPGSMESEQAVEGTKILYSTVDHTIIRPYFLEYPPILKPKYRLEHLPIDCTPVFEIIYPANRIVVDYGEVRELVLLAIFEHNGIEWHPRRVDQIAERCGFRRPQRYNVDLQGEIPFDDNSEGYVARFENGLRVKIKSPGYLRIHRLLNSLSPKGVVELIRGKEYGSVLSQLPKEIAKDFDDVRAYVQGIYNRILTDAHEHHNSLLQNMGTDATRRQYALWIQANVPNAECGFVFALLDGKDIEYKIWKLVLEKVKEERGKVPIGE